MLYVGYQRHAEISNLKLSVRCAEVTSSAIDPFNDIDLIEGMNDLISHVMGTRSEAYTLDIFTSGENGLSVCAEFQHEIWDSDRKCT